MPSFEILIPLIQGRPRYWQLFFSSPQGIVTFSQGGEPVVRRVGSLRWLLYGVQFFGQTSVASMWFAVKSCLASPHPFPFTCFYKILGFEDKEREKEKSFSVQTHSLIEVCLETGQASKDFLLSLPFTVTPHPEFHPVCSAQRAGGKRWFSQLQTRPFLTSLTHWIRVCSLTPANQIVPLSICNVGLLMPRTKETHCGLSNSVLSSRTGFLQGSCLVTFLCTHLLSMSFSPYFLVSVTHLLNPLCQSEQGVISYLELALQTDWLSAPGRALRITGEFSWWGHWDHLMKPFPQVCVFFAFMKYTWRTMNKIKPGQIDSVLLKWLPSYKVDFFILLASFLSAGVKLSTVGSDFGAEIPSRP